MRCTQGYNRGGGGQWARVWRGKAPCSARGRTRRDPTPHLSSALAAKSKICSMARGVMPFSLSSSILGPIMVCVLPEPVWPYASRQPLYPSSTSAGGPHASARKRPCGPAGEGGAPRGNPTYPAQWAARRQCTPPSGRCWWRTLGLHATHNNITAQPHRAGKGGGLCRHRDHQPVYKAVCSVAIRTKGEVVARAIQCLHQITYTTQALTPCRGIPSSFAAPPPPHTHSESVAQGGPDNRNHHVRASACVCACGSVCVRAGGALLQGLLVLAKGHAQPQRLTFSAMDVDWPSGMSTEHRLPCAISILFSGRKRQHTCAGEGRAFSASGRKMTCGNAPGSQRFLRLQPQSTWERHRRRGVTPTTPTIETSSCLEDVRGVHAVTVKGRAGPVHTKALQQAGRMRHCAPAVTYPDARGPRAHIRLRQTVQRTVGSKTKKNAE
jgi:hypothetical protein